MGNQELLERAFNLAESGEVTSINELCSALMGDGVPLADLAQFHGRALARQLCGKMAAARRTVTAKPPRRSDA